jgi:phosphinothricin acetyltransferase
MPPVTIRAADPEPDSAACATIYGPSVTAGATSFEETAPSAEEFAARIARISVTHPWLVAESDGEVIGYAYACQHRQRPAYRWAVDVSVYIADGQRRKGVGLHLYEVLLERLRRQRFRTACAGITLPNEASVVLHERLGFVAVGVFHGVGWKAGAWRDVGWWELDLGPASGDPPGEPLAPVTR